MTDLFVWSNVIVGMALTALAIDLSTVLIERFRHVGWRYRAIIVSGYVFVICAIIGYGTANIDSSEWYKQVLVVVQALSGIILVTVAIGHIDFVLRTKQRVKSLR